MGLSSGNDTGIYRIRFLGWTIIILICELKLWELGGLLSSIFPDSGRIIEFAKG